MRSYLLFLVAGLPGVAVAATGPHCAVSAASLDRIASTQTPAVLKYPSPVMPAGNQPVLSPLKTSPSPTPRTAPSPNTATAASSVAGQPSQKVPASLPASGSTLHLSVAALPQAQTSSPPSKPVLRSVRGLPMPASVVPISAVEIASVPALRLIASHGARLYSLGTVDGMRGVFARSGKLFSVFYIAPNGRSEIQGEMWSDHGKNITLRQVAAVPGVLPTVTIGKIGLDQPVKHLVAHTTPAPAAVPTTPLPSAPLPRPTTQAQKAREVASVFKMLQGTVHGTVGQPNAPHLWMVIDPMCIHSIHAMQALAPYVNQGKLRLSVIPVSILDYEDKGESTLKAKAMVSREPDQMVADWIDKGLPEAATPGAGAKLRHNMAAARYIGLTGTPTLLWRANDGLIGRSNGNPGHLAALIASIQSPD